MGSGGGAAGSGWWWVRWVVYLDGSDAGLMESGARLCWKVRVGLWVLSVQWSMAVLCCCVVGASDGVGKCGSGV